MNLDFSQPLPTLRSSIDVHISTFEGNEVLIIHDHEGIAERDIMLDVQTLSILEKLDGMHTLHGLHAVLTSTNDGAQETVQETENGHVHGAVQGPLALSELASFIQALDESCLLESDTFFETRLFIDSDVRHAVCDGVCYPSSPDELHGFLDEILQSSPSRSYPTDAKAILAPHIDFRVDTEIYAAPFNAIRDSEFDLVVHIGTSHYGWQDRFILSSKDFVTPLGVLRTDKALVERVHERMGSSLTRNDVAYQPEHSLEFHHLFLQHLFPKKQFTILPVLVTSFSDHSARQRDPLRDGHVRAFINALSDVVTESGRTALWIVSGDLAHVGKRFGDEVDAQSMLDTVRAEDFEIMNAVAKSNADELFELIARNADRRRICGLPPLWTMLKCLKPASGMALGYDQWDDAPTDSAVSYGSAAWW